MEVSLFTVFEPPNSDDILLLVVGTLLWLAVAISGIFNFLTVAPSKDNILLFYYFTAHKGDGHKGLVDR